MILPLHGPLTSIVLEDHALTQAQSLMDAGHATEAVALLHGIVERTRGLTGEGVAVNMPRTLGSLGAA